MGRNTGHVSVASESAIGRTGGKVADMQGRVGRFGYSALVVIRGGS